MRKDLGLRKKVLKNKGKKNVKEQRFKGFILGKSLPQKGRLSGDIGDV